MAHVRGPRGVLAVPAVVDHQHAPIVRRRRRVRQQQFQPPVIDPLRVPPGLGQEELQPLHRRVLRPATGSAPASALVSLTAGLGALAATLLLCAALAAPRSHASPPPPPVGVT